MKARDPRALHRGLPFKSSQGPRHGRCEGRQELPAGDRDMTACSPRRDTVVPVDEIGPVIYPEDHEAGLQFEDESGAESSCGCRAPFFQSQDSN